MQCLISVLVSFPFAKSLFPPSSHSIMSEPQQTPTPEKTPAKSKSRPPQPSRTNSEQSVGSQADTEDQGYESRSRSQSRRRRRQNQRQRQAKGKAQAGNAQATSIAERPEEEAEEEVNRGPEWLNNPATQDTTEVQPFESIKPPSQSMDGPVTYARMMRGEIPMRGKPPSQPYETTQGADGKTKEKDPMDQDGLKLRLELNLDIEIELKAHIHGDLTLALLLVVPFSPTDIGLKADIVTQGLICQYRKSSYRKSACRSSNYRRSIFPKWKCPTCYNSYWRRRWDHFKSVCHT